MKKSLFLTFAACFVALGIFTAFADGMTAEEKEQQQTIADLLTEKLDAFRIEKEQECQDRAIEAAVIKADEMMAEAAGSKKTVTRKPVRKKPTYTTKGTETTTPPPPPPPKTKEEKAADNVRDKMQKAKEQPSTKKTTAPEMTEEKKEEVRSKVRSKIKKAKGEN